MTTDSISRTSAYSLLTRVALIAAVILVLGGGGGNVVEADEFPTFFLKAAKSVPRIGRRSGNYDDFLRRIANTVPRIGRHAGFAPSSIKATGSWPWYRNTDSFPGPSKRPIDFSSTQGEEQWENLARFMEESPELLNMVAAYTSDIPVAPPSAAGFENEMWQREKRTGNAQAAA